MKQLWVDDVKVYEKFGVPPKKVIDVQSLAGDSSDNIPGVPGIGIKTAAELINEYGNLEELLLRAAEIKQNKRRQNLIEFADQARLSRSLVTLEKNVPVISEIEDFKINPVLDLNKLIPFLETHNFKSLINKFKNNERNELIASKSNSTELIKNDIIEFNGSSDDYELINKATSLKEFISNCYGQSIISVDCETNSLDAKTASLIGISISYSEGKACYIPLRHGLDLVNDQSDFILDNKTSYSQLPFLEAISIIRPLLEDSSILKVGHNIKYDALVMKQNHNGNILLHPIGDTMCLSYVVDPGRVDNHKLDSFCLLYTSPSPRDRTRIRMPSSA